MFMHLICMYYLHDFILQKWWERQHKRFSFYLSLSVKLNDDDDDSYADYYVALALLYLLTDFKKVELVEGYINFSLVPLLLFLQLQYNFSLFSSTSFWFLHVELVEREL